MRTVASFALALSLGLPSSLAAWASLLTNAAVVDVETVGLAEGTSVLLRDGVIVAVGDDIVAGEAVRADAGGGFLIPWLWDSHVHIFSTPDEPETAPPRYLINGITGIRDMGGLWPIGDQQALQARIEAGEVPGPRMILLGAWVDAAGNVIPAASPNASRSKSAASLRACSSRASIPRTLFSSSCMAGRAWSSSSWNRTIPRGASDTSRWSGGSSGAPASPLPPTSRPRP